MNKQPDILYEDKDIIVCIKPPGVPTQTKKTGMADMVSLLKNYRAVNGEDTYLGVIHRLDQPVEGILVFAKNAKAAAALSRQTANNEMEKCYLAVSAKRPPKEQGTLEDYLVKDGRTNMSSVRDMKVPQAKKAVLEYRVCAEKDEHVLIQIRLITGRHHQIRVQTAHHGFPLLGDTKYNPAYKLKKPEGSVALCAYQLAFEHPLTKKQLEFEITPSTFYYHVYQT